MKSSPSTGALIPKKIVIGVRPNIKMMRVASLSGVIVDALMDIRGTGNISDEYFTGFARAQGVDGTTGVLLTSNDHGNELHILPTDILFMKSTYGSDASVDYDRAFEEFLTLWSAINGLINVEDIRRIGMVAEHLFFEDTNPNARLFKLTNLEQPENPAAFRLHYENRTWVSKGEGRPDINSDDCYNFIYDYFTQEQEASIDESTADAKKSQNRDKIGINVNIDIQRYFLPYLNENYVRAFKQHYKLFRNRSIAFKDEVRNNSVFGDE